MRRLRCNSDLNTSKGDPIAGEAPRTEAGCKGRFVEPDFNSGLQVLYWPTNQVFRGLPALRTLETSRTNLLHCVEEMLHSMGTEVFEGTVQVSSTPHVLLWAKDQKTF